MNPSATAGRPGAGTAVGSNSTTTTSTSLRPRTRRLISIEGDEGIVDDRSEATHAISSSNSLRDAVDSAFSTSRHPSPRPSPHPSRGSSATRTSPYNSLRGEQRSFGLEIPTTSNGASPSRRGKASSLWASPWSSIQGVASTLLGGNAIEPNTPVTAGGSAYGKRKDRHVRNYSLSVPDEPWGPTGRPEDLLAAGSQEERLARVQAEKRKMLLSGMGDEQLDIMGRYKRRTSLDRTDSMPSPTHDDDALIYIHRVTPADSVAGLSIRYNCAQAVVRKANGLYPSDSIQLRKVAYLPVDACSIRGRKVPGPGQTNLELLAGTENTVVNSNRGLPNSVDADYHIATSPEPSRNVSSTPSVTGASTPSEPKQAWVHDSWVQLPHSSTPTEIGRLPRRTLGFFPPARRKSVTSAAYTDSSPPRSATSSIPPSNAVPSLSTPASVDTSPARAKSPGRPPIGRLSRSSSTASKLNPHTRHAASLFLRGPGGVGSLHSSVHGPAPDELNRFVAMHMPQLIIEGAVDGNGSVSGVGGIRGLGSSRQRASSGTHRPSIGISGPRISFDRVSVASGGSSTGAGVEAMAGAVEGWMRKVGGRVKESLGTPEMRGRAAGGDLIELVEGWDLNGAEGAGGEGGGGVGGTSDRDSAAMADSWESQGHGVLDDGPAGMNANGGANGGGGAAATAAAAIPGDGAAGSGTGAGAGKGKSRASARENEEEKLLRERFPPAGRVFEEQQQSAAARRRL